MAHSYLEHGTHFKSLNDGKLTYVALFTARFVRHWKLERFFPMAADWEEGFEWFPPGAIDLHLQELFPDTKALKELGALLCQARDDLDKYGDHISEQILQDIVKSDWSSPGDGVEISTRLSILSTRHPTEADEAVGTSWMPRAL